ncbi:MAG: single-stranded-DNA-specific exonuclease RecJ [Rhizomicrobium sp.]
MTAVLNVEQSFTGRRWVLPEVDEDAVRATSRAANISPWLGRILTARGVAAEDAGKYLNPTLRDLMPEPFRLKDMEKAVARAQRAIASGERIAVFGDYDVDGSSSSALLAGFLADIGCSQTIYIPDRMSEGYGPSAAALLKLKDSGIDLVVTVDCGAAAIEPLKAAHEAGLDVIVLDHHSIEAPNEWAYAQVNPNQPGDLSGQSQLCAAGVVFLFLVALNRGLRDCGWYTSNAMTPPDLLELVDLVGLATICDVVPLTGINRAFVRTALARISANPRPGLNAISQIAKIDGPITPYHFGYVFGPRINAGGRVGRCSLGAELLSARDPECAMVVALQLERHNRERQAIEAIIVEEAIAQASTQDNQPFLLVAGEGWHSGVVGIVAGRLKERFSKPAIAIGLENGAGRGSARSVPGFDIGAAVRTARERGLVGNGGGHAMAAGFSLPANGLDALREFFLEQFAQRAVGLDNDRSLELSGLVSPAGATVALIEEIAKAGPYGSGNMEPRLALPDVRVAFADVVGKDHVRMRLEGGGGRLNAIAFRAANSPLGEGLLGARGGRIHAAGTLKSDRWNGRAQVQLIVEDAASAGP